MAENKQDKKRLSDIPVKEIKEGDSFIAEYIRVDEVTTINGKSNLYTFKDKDNELFKIWGCASLDTDLRVAVVGSRYQIKHEGMGEAKKGKNAPKKIFVYAA